MHNMYHHGATAITSTGFLFSLVSLTLSWPIVFMTISTIATVAGVILQFWLAFGKQRALEEEINRLKEKLK